MKVREKNIVANMIRAALKARSRKKWSVKTELAGDACYLNITAPLKRIGAGGLTEEDRAELAELLGLESVGIGGVFVFANFANFEEYILRAKGKHEEAREQEKFSAKYKNIQIPI